MIDVATTPLSSHYRKKGFVSKLFIYEFLQNFVCSKRIIKKEIL